MCDTQKPTLIKISPKNSLDDKITGLDLGADNYLPKPFDLTELNSRIKVVIRRKSFDGDKAIVINEITITPEERSVKVNSKLVSLTAKEFDLLFFTTYKNRVVSKNKIAEYLFGDD